MNAGKWTTGWREFLVVQGMVVLALIIAAAPWFMQQTSGKGRGLHVASLAMLVAAAAHHRWWRRREWAHLQQTNLDVFLIRRWIKVNWWSAGPPLLAGACWMASIVALVLWSREPGGWTGALSRFAGQGGASVLWLGFLSLAPALIYGRYIEPGPRCARCHYCIAGVERYVCPECGLALTADDAVAPGVRRRSRAVLVVGAVAAAAAAPVGVIAGGSLIGRSFSAGTNWSANAALLPVSDMERQGELWDAIERRMPLTPAQKESLADRALTALETFQPPRLHWRILHWLAQRAQAGELTPQELRRAVAAIAQSPLSPAADALLPHLIALPLPESDAAALDAVCLERLALLDARADASIPWLAARWIGDALSPADARRLAHMTTAFNAAPGGDERVEALFAAALRAATSPEQRSAHARAALLRLEAWPLDAPTPAQCERVILAAAASGGLTEDELLRAVVTRRGAAIIGRLVAANPQGPAADAAAHAALTLLNETPTRAQRDLRYVWRWLEAESRAGALNDRNAAAFQHASERLQSPHDTPRGGAGGV